MNKNVFIYGKGKWQQDFEYIFQNRLDIRGYILDGETEKQYNQKRVIDITQISKELDFAKDFVIVCTRDKERWLKHAKKYGLNEGENYQFSSWFFSYLDENIRDYCPEKEKIAVISDGTLFEDWKRKSFEFENIDAIVDDREEFQGLYFFGRPIIKSDQKSEVYYAVDKMHSKIYNSLAICELLRYKLFQVENPEDCKNFFTVIFSDEYIKYYRELTQIGLVEGTDFISYKRLLIDNAYHLPSVMMNQTMREIPLDEPDCEWPFYRTFIRPDGIINGCCWAKAPLGDYRYKQFQTIWRGVRAQIFRLSLINKTYTFCRKKDCIFLSGEERQNKNISRMKDTSVRLTPGFVEIGVDYTCNLYCPSCRTEIKTAKGKDKEFLDFTAERIKQSGWMDKADRIQMSGMGEVFVSKFNRDLLYNTEAKRDCCIAILSNGNLFTVKEFEKIRAIYREIEVSISVDAATEETYRKLRRGGDFNRVLENLKMLGENLKKGYIKSLRIDMLVQRDNYNEIPEFVKLGKSINASVISFSPIFRTEAIPLEVFNFISMRDVEGKLLPELEEVLMDPLLNEKEVWMPYFKNRMRKKHEI